MPYSARLNPWAVVRLLPNCQRVTIARHRSESDAAGYCRILHRLEPQADLIVIFDPISEEISTQIPDRPSSKIRSITPDAIAMVQTRKVEVVPHNPLWQDAFEAEADLIADILGDNVAAIHHIGSTAIPNIYAKPIIDILVAVGDITQVDDRNLAMESLGYEAMGEFGIPDRRYFRKCNRFGTRTHHVHTFEVGSVQIERHLAFRDYMRTHTDDARQYSQLKQQLAGRYPQDIEGYMDGKDGFIKDMDKKAAAWRKSSIGG